MRPLVLAFVLAPALFAAPLAQAGGTVSCEPIPHLGPWIGAFGTCTMAFTATAAGPMVFQVEAVVVNFGNVVFDAVGPGTGRVVVDCPLSGASASCFAVFNEVFVGPWTVTAHAQVAYATNDAWIKTSVSFP